MNKTLHVLVASVMLLGAMPIFLPGADAQAANDVVITDPSGDVKVVTPVEQAHATAQGTEAPLPQGFNQIDITEVRIYGETATEFWMGFTVAGFEKTGPMPHQSVYVVCFKWSSTGATYRLWVNLNYPPGGATSAPMDRVGVTFTELVDPAHCDINTFAGSANNGNMPFTVLEPIIDGGKLDIRIPRLEMENIRAANEPPKPVPKKGETFTEIQAKAAVKTGSSVYHAVDYVPPASDAFTFTSDTGNSVLRVIVNENIHTGSAGVDTSGGVPIYGVEIGSFQTVPLTIENHLPEPLNVQLFAEVIQADDKGAWQTRILPAINVKGAVDGEPGSEIVTLIVNTQQSVSHKDRARVLVRAIDERYDDMLGAGLVDVLAVQPPSKTQNTLYFHTTGRTCNTADHWINTLPQDTKALSGQVLLESCDAQGGSSLTASTAPAITFRPDVPFARDYRLSTGDSATGKIFLRSLARIPGQEADVPMTIIADVTVALYSGGTVIGEQKLPAQAIESTATEIPFSLPIEAPILGASTRDVPDSKPLAVRVQVEKQQRTYLVDACPDPEGAVCFQSEQPVPDPSTVAGNIFFVSADSEIKLPIVSSERSGDIVNITASGALITLRLAELEAERQRITNPGKVVIYNVTVRNEGVNQDTATISVAANTTGWTAEVLPTNKIKLGIAEAASFEIKLTAPATAAENSLHGITVTATSSVDKEAQASLPLSVVLTTGQQYESDAETLEKLKEAKDSPAPGLVPLVLLGVLVAVVLRRRRRQ